MSRGIDWELLLRAGCSRGYSCYFELGSRGCTPQLTNSDPRLQHAAAAADFNWSSGCSRCLKAGAAAAADSFEPRAAAAVPAASSMSRDGGRRCLELGAAGAAEASQPRLLQAATAGWKRSRGFEAAGPRTGASAAARFRAGTAAVAGLDFELGAAAAACGRRAAEPRLQPRIQTGSRGCRTRLPGLEPRLQPRLRTRNHGCSRLQPRLRSHGALGCSRGPDSELWLQQAAAAARSRISGSWSGRLQLRPPFRSRGFSQGCEP